MFNILLAAASVGNAAAFVYLFYKVKQTRKEFLNSDLFQGAMSHAASAKKNKDRAEAAAKVAGVHAKTAGEHADVLRAMADVNMARVAAASLARAGVATPATTPTENEDTPPTTSSKDIAKHILNTPDVTF